MLNLPTPPPIEHSPLWYIIVDREYFLKGRVGGFNLRRRGLGIGFVAWGHGFLETCLFMSGS